jgi:uncharacterized protein (DUF1330 family)
MENAMPAYLIAEVEITDPATFQEYVAKAGPTLAAASARLLANGPARAKEGTHPVGNIVVIEFPSLDAAERWYGTPPYKDAIPLRQRSANSRLFFVEGASR